MKTARIAWAGAIHAVTELNGGLRLGDGREVNETEVVWLPPVEAGTVFAVTSHEIENADT